MATNSGVKVGITPASGRTTRRQFTGALAGLAAAGFAGARVRAQSVTPPASPVRAEGWTFTDDAGETVSVPAAPARIVADLNAASALWDFGIRPIAVTGYTVTTDAAWGNVDRETPVINAGPETGAPDMEQLVALNPDLFVTITWSPDNRETAYEWTFPEPEQEALARELVPIVAISATGQADVNTVRFAELAASLGADLSSPEMAAAKEAFDGAVERFSALAAEKSDLTNLFVYADGENEYIANWPKWADLAWYNALGLNIVKPDVAETEYWLQLSPELALTYPSDLLFQSTRMEVLSLDELAAHPTYGRLPAVEAGQLSPWNQDFIMSYQGLTAALETVIAALTDAEKITE